ncbi:hypothetical protein HY469_02405 [Candidatus Roizmanbacteria bacterium]|nr:hypothetical protein [Candidatus Roizmanbacteria bacterium]
MTENKDRHHLKEEEFSDLLHVWQEQSLPTERYEYVEGAASLLAQACYTGQPLTIVSPLCANYETMRIAGKKHPTLHPDMVWHDRGLRKGYVLLHEEIPARLAELNRAGIPLNYLIVIVDLGMNAVISSDNNPDLVGLPADDRKARISSIVSENAQTAASLVAHGLSQQDMDPAITLNTAVHRLSSLVSPAHHSTNNGFVSLWNDWNGTLRGLIDKPNNRWGGLIREALEKDGRYFREAWGMETDEEILKWVVDCNFGLTAAVGDALPQFANSVYGHTTRVPNKGSVLLLDTIPGPHNPGHREFFAYNLDHPYGQERPRTPVVRPFHNLVLLSDPAREVPYLPKSLEEMQDEANQFGF